MSWVAEEEDVVESIDVAEEAPRQRDRQQGLRASRQEDLPPEHEDVDEDLPKKAKGKYLIPGIAAVALVMALLPLGAFVLKSINGGGQQVAANPGMGQQLQQPQPYYQAPPPGQQPNNGFGPTQPQPNPNAYPQQAAPAQVAQQYAPQSQQPQPSAYVQPAAGAAVATADAQGGPQPGRPQGNDMPMAGAAQPVPQPAMAAPEDVAAGAAKVAAQVTEALAKDIGDTKLAIGGLAVTTTETKETLVAVSAKVDDLARSVDQLREEIEKLVGKKASRSAKVSREQPSQTASPPAVQTALTAQVAAPPPAPPAAVSTPPRRSAPAQPRGAVYTVRAVSGGQAWLSDEQGNMKQVGPGSNLDGYGSVLRVFQPDGTRWVVDTTNGRIEQH